MEKAELEGRAYKGYYHFNLLPKVKEIYSNDYGRERLFRLTVKTPGASSLYLLQHISLEIGIINHLWCSLTNSFSELIRRTWGSRDQLKIPDSIVVFVIGEFNDEILQNEVAKESERYVKYRYRDFAHLYTTWKIWRHSSRKVWRIIPQISLQVNVSTSLDSGVLRKCGILFTLPNYVWLCLIRFHGLWRQMMIL